MSTILIVEDNDAQCLLYETELSQEGYEVILANDGIEALKTIDSRHPDLIVMDIMMPRMDGLQTLQKKLDTYPQIPVIIHSAVQNFQKDRRSWSAEEYVIKSSDLTHLKNAIKRALSHWPYVEKESL